MKVNSTTKYLEIRKEFLQETINKQHDNATLVNFKVENGSTMGDNFTSVMLAVEAEILENGTTEKVHLMVKRFPESPIRQQSFEGMNLFDKEVKLYSVIHEDMIHHQKELFLKPIQLAIPLFYDGSSTSQNGNFVVMDNLKAKGYQMLDRVAGPSLSHCKIVMNELAKIHASSMLLKKNGLLDKYSEALQPGWVPNNIPFLSDFCENMFAMTINVIKEHSNRQDDVHRLEIFKGNILETTSKKINSFEEPYASVCHGDCWTNNMMFKSKPNNKGIEDPEEMKLFDWQFTCYGSLNLDLSYFLYTSLDPSFRKDHLEDLLKLYYDTIIQTLSYLKQDTSNFTFESFHEDWVRIRLYGYLLGMTFILKVKAPPENEVDLDSVEHIGSDKSDFNDKFTSYSNNLDPKVIDLVIAQFDEGIDENII